MPVCYGKLTLQGVQDGEGGVRAVADSGSEVSGFVSESERSELQRLGQSWIELGKVGSDGVLCAALQD